MADEAQALEKVTEGPRRPWAMDPEIDFITLLGQAGTGKTLLTLAAGLTQVLETKHYSEIIMEGRPATIIKSPGWRPEVF